MVARSAGSEDAAVPLKIALCSEKMRKKCAESSCAESPHLRSSLSQWHASQLRCVVKAVSSMTNGWKKLHAGCCSIPATLRRGRIRSEDGPGPVNNVEAILGAAGNCSRHVQVFGAQKWRCGGRHRPCSGRPDQEILSSRCVDDGPDSAEVSNRTRAQEVRYGASGHVPTHRKGPNRQS